MTKKVIKAIKASIEHWEWDIVKPLKEGDTIIKMDGHHWSATGLRVKIGHGDCALCILYEDQEWGYDCDKCPLHHCGSGSAYSEFAYNPCLKTAQAMVRKLKSLLPKEV